MQVAAVVVVELGLAGLGWERSSVALPGRGGCVWVEEKDARWV